MEDLKKLSDDDLDQVSGGVTMNAIRLNEDKKKGRYDQFAAPSGAQAAGVPGDVQAVRGVTDRPKDKMEYINPYR